MKRNCKELKRIARENLSVSGYTLPMQAFILTSLIASLIEFPFSMLKTEDVLFSTQNIIYYIAQVIISLVSILLTCGQYRIHSSIAQHKKTTTKELFFYIKNMPDRYILARFAKFGLTILCMIPIFIGTYLIVFKNLILVSLILILIGSIITLLFSLTFDLLFLVLMDNENFSIKEAFGHTKMLMKGNIGKYFYLQLSFLGMGLLVVFSLGLAFLWVQPYMTQTLVLFYYELTGQLDKIEVYKYQKTENANVFEEYI